MSNLLVPGFFRKILTNGIIPAGRLRLHSHTNKVCLPGMRVLQPAWGGLDSVGTFLTTIRPNVSTLVNVMLPLSCIVAGIGGFPDFARACTDDQCLRQRQWQKEDLERAIEWQRRQQEEWDWQQQQQYQPPAPQPKDPWVPLINYPVNAALVWWHDSQQKPGFSLAVRRYSPIQAMDDAMNHCFLKGGQSCRVAFVSSAAWIAVAKGQDGSLHAAQGGKEDEARQAALSRCNASSKGCAIATLIQNNK